MSERLLQEPRVWPISALCPNEDPSQRLRRRRYFGAREFLLILASASILYETPTRLRCGPNGEPPK